MKYLFLFFLLLLPIQTEAATLLNHFTGWESGVSCDGCSVTSGTMGAVSSTSADGTYSFRSNPTSTGTGYMVLESYSKATGGLGADPVPSNYAMISFDFMWWVKPTSGSESILRANVGAGGQKWNLFLDSSGVLVLGNRFSVGAATGTTALTQGQWYHICVAVESGSGAGNEGDVWLNGVSEIATTTLDTVSTSHGQMLIGKGWDRGGNSVDFYYDNAIAYYGNNDDTVTCDSTSSIRTARANGNGTDTGHTAGTGASDYLEVDDALAAPDTTTYVQSPSADTYSTFAMQDASTIGLGSCDTITAVRADSYGREATSGTAIYMNRAYANGTATTTTTGLDIGTTFVYTGQLLKQADLATNWTQALFNGMEVGAGDGAGSSVRTRTSWVTASVLYTPVTCPATSGETIVNSFWW